MRLQLGVLIILVVVIFGYFRWEYQKNNGFKSPADLSFESKEKPLDKYTFEALSKTKFEPSEIVLGEVLAKNPDFTSRTFFLHVDGPSAGLRQAKRVSGLINIPDGEGSFGVIVMFRGYVDREVYTTGTGTQRAAEVFAGKGFVTLAPDFLGYGESDDQPANEMEERFLTYTTAITLLESIENFNEVFKKEGIEARVDPDKVGIWGHSNGGQIAISVLEITQKPTPTVLWAPVSKPFPYSVLYYTDEFDDRGKYLRGVIAEFEKDYDVDNYSIEKYFDRINAPLQLHQGSLDDAVPRSWSDEFVEEMENLDKDTNYFIYSDADHNLLPSGWDSAVSRSIQFYGNHFAD